LDRSGKLKNCFLLVDFENIQPKDIGALNGLPFRIKVFVGAHQARIPIDTARALQAFGSNAEYIQIDGSGRNALDFHIAYYIGRLAAETSDACFYLISKDSGFDPLIRHLTAQKILCRRLTSIADVHLRQTPNSLSVSEKLDVVIDNLTRRKAARPRTLKTLRSSIKALFGNRLMDEELDTLIEALTQRTAIKIVDGKVHYTLAHDC
jgi:PIN domain